MNYKHLLSFVFLARELHFGRTAERLAITQSALTAHIQSLEKSLGVRLLNRGRHTRVSLTGPGELFFEEARQTVEQFERAKLVGLRAKRGEVGRLEIGFVASAVFCGLVGAAIGNFSRKRKEILVSLQEMTTPDQIEALLSGKIDVGFVRDIPVRGTGVSSFTLLDEDIIVALPRLHRLAAGRSVSPDQLRNSCFAVTLPHDNGGLYEHVCALAKAGGFEPSVTHRVANLSSLLGVVASGLCLALVPRSLARVDVEGIVYRPLKGISLREPLLLAFRTNERAVVAQEFIRIVRLFRNADRAQGGRRLYGALGSSRADG